MGIFTKTEIIRQMNSDASAVPILLFILTIIVCGALYTMFFLEIALPSLKGLIPASDSKTFILMIIYAIPMIITFVGVISLIKEGQKKMYGGPIQ